MKLTTRHAALLAIQDLIGQDAVILDTETTGSAPEEEPEIIELAILRFRNGEELYEQRFEPLRPSLPGAQAVHQIQPEALVGQPRFREHIESIEAILGDAPVIAWGANFDKRIMDTEYQRAGAEPTNPQRRWHCASILYHMLELGNTQDRYSTAKAAKREGIPIVGLHSAMGDIHMIRSILLSAAGIQPSARKGINL